jgi:ATP-binding cassette subfamily G (WHITE) protein 2 (PDR)
MSAGIASVEVNALTEAIHLEPAKFDSSSSSEYDNKDNDRQDVQHDRQVHELVRKFTSRSEQHHIGSPFTDDPHHWLDPKSDQFQARKWAGSFYDLRYSSEEAIPRVAGVAFKSLNVWGKGSPTDFQSTVGNTILKLPSLFGRGVHKIEILRDLDGLLLPGEQFCVLGPPGYVLLHPVPDAQLM